MLLWWVSWAHWRTYKPAIIFLGKHPWYRVVNSYVETMHNCIPPCYFCQLDPAGMNSQIFIDWERNFPNETEPQQRNGNHIVLVYEGYKCHIQYEILSLFKTSSVVKIFLPAHTSHLLQSLGVSAFIASSRYYNESFNEPPERENLGLFRRWNDNYRKPPYYNAFTRRKI